MSNRDIGIRALIPGQRSLDEIKEDQKAKQYIDTVLKSSSDVDPLETFLRTTPSINLSTPKEETRETPMNLDKVLIDQAKGAEMVKKARQDPQWVDSYNKRFGPHFKTTVLPNEKTIQQLKALKEHHQPTPVGLGNKYKSDHRTPVEKKRDGHNARVEASKGNYIPWYDRMAQEEAEHLNSMKRQTWKHGGSVGPEPKYVSTQDVQNVYDQPKASPVQMKQLHKRLENHNERTGEFKNLPKEEDHPYLKGIEEDLQKIDNKGKSWFSKHLKKENKQPALPGVNWGKQKE